MIWVDGKIVGDDDLKVSVLDRTFEHGLGLFETLRTWSGRAPLLARHLQRLERSSRELGISLNSVSLPDQEAVARLVEAEGIGGDVALRITLTGGRDAIQGSTLFMRTRPLPVEMRREGAVVDIGSWRVPVFDPLARHKSLNYWTRRRAYESAQAMGFDEVLSTPEDVSAEFTALEGSRTNIFVLRGTRLTTPPLNLPIVPGIMRGLVIELARELGIEVFEKTFWDGHTFGLGSEVFLTNSVRGIIPVNKVIRADPFRVFERPAPGPLTQRLMILTSDWLRSWRECS